MADHRPIACRPPVAVEEPRHDSIATAAMPDQEPARLQHARELADDARIIGGIEKESERGEEIDCGVEAAAPGRREMPHVTARVFQIGAGSPPGGQGEQIA